MMKRLMTVGLILLMVFSLSGCGGKESAENVVSVTLDALKALDFEKASEYMDDSGVIEDTDDEQEAMIKPIFENLSYKIISSEEKDDKATVTVEITNVDIGKIFAEYMQEALGLVFSGLEESELEVKMVEIWNDLIRAEDAVMATNKVDVNLEKIDDKWKIKSDEEFMNAILGGFVNVVESMGTLGE